LNTKQKVQVELTDFKTGFTAGNLCKAVYCFQATFGEQRQGGVQQCVYKIVAGRMSIQQ